MQEAEEAEATRYRNLPLPLRIVFLLFTVAGIVLGIIYVFALRFQEYYLVEYSYYYLLLALFLSCIFLLLPARKKDKTRFPWYDLLGAAQLFRQDHLFESTEDL